MLDEITIQAEREEARQHAAVETDDIQNLLNAILISKGPARRVLGDEYERKFTKRTIILQPNESTNYIKGYSDVIEVFGRAMCIDYVK